MASLKSMFSSSKAGKRLTGFLESLSKSRVAARYDRQKKAELKERLKTAPDRTDGLEILLSEIRLSKERDMTIRHLGVIVTEKNRPDYITIWAALVLQRLAEAGVDITSAKENISKSLKHEDDLPGPTSDHLIKAMKLLVGRELELPFQRPEKKSKTK